MLEMRLIGAVMVDPRGTNWILCEKIEPEDFTEPLLRTIWLAVVQTFAESGHYARVTLNSLHATMLSTGQSIDRGEGESAFRLLVNLHHWAELYDDDPAVYADELIRIRGESLVA
jgi:hypothetical protein